jgi:hypothetical protein
MAKKKDRGWIRVYRSIKHNFLWTSSEPYDKRSAWIDLLLSVNHEDRTIMINGRPQVIGEGQRWLSQIALAKRWKWSRNRVNRYLHILVEQRMVTLSGTPSGTLLTIVNYGNFQTGRATDGATDGATDRTSNGATDGAQTITNKQELINKNDKQIARPRKLISEDDDRQ